MANSGSVSGLFNAQIEGLNHDLWTFRHGNGSKAPKNMDKTRSTGGVSDEEALTFLDGPLLYHVFPSLQGHLRHRLFELSLPLLEIRELRDRLPNISSGDLEYYRTTKEEAEIRIAKIVNELDTVHYDQAAENLSYDDAEPRNALQVCVDTISKSYRAMFEDMNAWCLTQSGKGTVTQPTLENAARQSSASQTPSSPRTSSQQAVSQTQQVDQDIVDINLATQQKAHEKELELLAFQRQRDEARRIRFRVHFQAYDILIGQLRTYRTGGPPRIKPFSMSSACMTPNLASTG